MSFGLDRYAVLEMRTKKKRKESGLAVEDTYQITNAPGKLRKRATARHLDIFQLNRSLNTKTKGKTTARIYWKSQEAV